MNRWLLFGQPKLRASKVRESGAGYTITEVIIVLAVSTLLFVAIAASFGGRQGRAMFTQAVRNYEARIQTVANDVVSGRFKGGESCLGSVVGTDPPGSSENCIFLGKLLVARTAETDVMTIIGQRTPTLNPTVDVSTLAQAEPVGLPNVSDVKANTYGLEVRKIYVLNAAGVPGAEVGAFGYISELGGGISSTGVTTSGSRSLRLYGLTGSTAPLDEVWTATLSRITPTSLSPLSNGIRICVEGGNGQWAEIVVGAGNNQTSITTTILETINATNCPNAEI